MSFQFYVPFSLLLSVVVIGTFVGCQHAQNSDNQRVIINQDSLLFEQEQQRLATIVTPTMKTMSGRWQSKDDPKYSLHIQGNQFDEFYENAPETNSTFAFYNKCKHMGGTIDTATTDFIVVDNSKEARCFYVEKIEAKELVLVYVNQGTKFLFKKI